MMVSHISNPFLLFIVIFTTILLRLSSSFEIPTIKYTSILGPKLDKFPDEDEVLKLFQLWKTEHGRVYGDLELMAKKFEIFVSNLKYIIETNAKRDSPHSSLLGLTNFADMSSEEFEERYLRGIDMPAAVDLDDTVNVQDDDVQLSISCSAPSSLDWRTKDGGAVTYVQDQTNHCLSCWAFSTVGAIEGITAIVERRLVKLSVQELVDCDQGCNPGWVPKAFDWVIKNKGIALDQKYPYTAKNGVCKASKIPNSAISSINSYKQVEISEKGLLCAVAKQPISVCLNVITQDFQHYVNGIYEGANCRDTTDSNHCMLIVGYDSPNGQNYWIVKNSWGTNWGIQGYMLIRRNTKKKYGVCGINAWAYNPVKTKTQAPGNLFSNFPFFK